MRIPEKGAHARGVLGRGGEKFLDEGHIGDGGGQWGGRDGCDDWEHRFYGLDVAEAVGVELEVADGLTEAELGDGVECEELAEEGKVGDACLLVGREVVALEDLHEGQDDVVDVALETRDVFARVAEGHGGFVAVMALGVGVGEDAPGWNDGGTVSNVVLDA